MNELASERDAAKIEICRLKAENERISKELSMMKSDDISKWEYGISISRFIEILDPKDGETLGDAAIRLKAENEQLREAAKAFLSGRTPTPGIQPMGDPLRAVFVTPTEFEALREAMGEK